MKRYLVFLGNEYYPEKGMLDFIDDFDTVEECRDIIDRIVFANIDIFGMSCNDRENFKALYFTDKWACTYDTVNKEHLEEHSYNMIC